MVLIRAQVSNSDSKSDLTGVETKSSQFLTRIRSILTRDQSIPFVTLRSSSTKLSDFDLEKNVLQYVKIFTEQYMQKQDKVRREIDDKQRYLVEVHQTQSNENKQLTDRFQEIRNQFEHSMKQYQQVRHRFSIRSRHFLFRSKGMFTSKAIIITYRRSLIYN